MRAVFVIPADYGRDGVKKAPEMCLSHYVMKKSSTEALCSWLTLEPVRTARYDVENRQWTASNVEVVDYLKATNANLKLML